MKVIVIEKKYLQLAFIILITMSLIGYKRWEGKTREVMSFLPISNKIIAIDPGHGGVDPGKVSKNGIKESDINLKISLKLKRLLEQSGAIVIMTRSKDVGLYTSEAQSLRQMKREDLKARKEMVEVNEAEIFISIHQNSFTQSQYYGAQTFYKKGSISSEKLALILQKDLKNVLDKNNNREPQNTEDIYLLNEINIPSVLIECGFLSNKEEESLLQDDFYQEKIAWSIYIGILNYYSQEDI